MRTSSDSAAIYSFLEKSSRLPADFSRAQTFCFSHEQGFYLVIYFPHGEKKGFELYEVEDFAGNKHELQELELLLQEKTEYFSEKELYSKASLLVQNFSRTMSAGNFFYDAH
ncbi:MAG: hypothetical protein AB1458_13800 [Bacteroidota bacterium]